MKHTIYKKTIILGKYPINGRNIATAAVEVNLTEDDDGFIEFVMGGTVYNTAHKDCHYFSGQCIDKFAEQFKTEKMKEMRDVWKRWHLNSMHPGCKHQRNFKDEPYEKHALEVCPICGHKYGIDWQREELPQEVLEKIKSW